MIALSCFFLLSFMTFQGQCCRINKMVMNPYNQDSCTDIQSAINCPPRFMKQGGLHHRAMPCPSLPNCDPYPTKMVSTILPPQLECMDPIMAKCCCIQCTKPFPCQCQALPMQMLPNDCWC